MRTEEEEDASGAFQKAAPDTADHDNNGTSPEVKAEKGHGQVPSLPPIASDVPYHNGTAKDDVLDVTSRSPEDKSELDAKDMRGQIHAQLGHYHKSPQHVHEHIPPEPESEPEKQAGARKAARSRIKARQELEMQVMQEAEAIRKAKQEAKAMSEKKAEDARRKARQRLATKKTSKPVPEMPKLQPSEVQTSESESEINGPRSRAPEVRAKARVKKMVERKRQEAATVRNKVDQERILREMQREDQKEKVIQHRAQLAREAYAKLREEKRKEEEAKYRKDAEEKEVRQKLEWYRNPTKIAERKLKAAAEAAVTPSMVEERQEQLRQEQQWMDEERARARHHLEGNGSEPFQPRAPEGKPRKPPKERPVQRKAANPPSDEEEELFATTVHALTDEEWTIRVLIA